MKKQLLSFLMFALIGLSANGQNVTTSLTGMFVEGVTPVLNDITLTDGAGTATQVDFYAIDGTGGVVNTYTDNFSSGTFTWNGVDMGILNQGSYIFTYVTDPTNGDWIDSVLLDIIPKPQWLINGGIISNVNPPSGTVIDMDGEFPLKTIFPPVQSDAKFLGGKDFGIGTNGLTFHIQYDYNDASSIVTNPQYSFNLKLFGYPTPIQNYPPNADLNLNISLDQNTFQLGSDAKYTKVRNFLDYRTPEVSFPFPPLPAIKIGFSAGLKVDGGLAVTSYYGNDGSGNFGFTADTIAFGVKVDANLRGTIKLLSKHIASAQGDLDLIGRIGLAYNFATVPTFTDGTQFGGDLKLKGRIEFFGFASGLATLLTGADVFEGQLWPYNLPPYEFGGGYPSVLNFPGFMPMNNNNTYRAMWQDEMPTYKPQPAMSARNADLKTVWIEEDIANDIEYLLLSVADSSGCTFSQNLIVAQNNFSMSNPKVASFSNGDAIITWTQNRYNASNAAGLDMEQVMDGQDIWFAIYDRATNAIIYTSVVSDVSNSRPEGQAKVTVGSGTDAIISWLVEDAGANTTDVYYLGLNDNLGSWTITNLSGAPEKIDDLAGNNTDVNISFVDPTNAVAVWINDADAADTTANNKIVSYLWNGTTWSALGDL